MEKQDLETHKSKSSCIGGDSVPHERNHLQLIGEVKWFWTSCTYL